MGETPMSVRAKFRVGGIRRFIMGGKEVQSVELHPVTGGTDENKTFFAATPSGKIELGCVNLEAASQFELEKEYYVDFCPAER
jgi:hypothetical protein